MVNIKKIQIESENLGGLLGKTKLELKPGINIIEAPNAAGKTSTVDAFTLSVLPSREALQHAHILHSAETKGSVKLIFNEKKIERTIIRRGVKGKELEMEIQGNSVASGDELGLIRRFAVADEHNPVLVKIRSGENLKDVLTEYAGVNTLKAEHEKLLEEKSDLQEKLKQGQEKIKEIEKLKNNLKEKEKKLRELESEKKKIYREKPENEEKTNLAELEREIAKAEADLKNVARDIAFAESFSKSRKEKLNAIEKRAAGGVEGIVEEIGAKENEIKTKEKDIRELEKMYALKSSELSHLRFIMESAQAYTAENKLAALISDEDQIIICPVCDHQTDYGQIRAKSQKTDEEVKRISRQKSELEERIGKLNREMAALNAKKSDIDAMETEKKRITQELGGHEKLHSQKLSNKKALEDKLKELGELKKTLVEKRRKEASESEDRKIDFEREMAVISNEIDNIQKEIKILESAVADVDKMEKKYTDVDKTIKGLAEEIEEREKGIIRIFNAEIKNIYKEMGFEKVNELILDDKFDLRVVRLSKAGAGYADAHSVKSLSKTEREVAGLILLLSGYRVFKIGEKYPFFIIDEISFMDMQRLTTFINNVKEKAQIVIITTIPGRELNLPDVAHIPLSIAVQQ